MKSSNLEKWLLDPRTDAYIGSAYALKIAILAGMLRGDCNLAAIARKHNVTRAAASKQAIRAKKIYDLPSTRS